ncbi:hypothetical protein, partial [Vibrio cholerae]
NNEVMLLRLLLVDIKRNELKKHIGELFKLRGKVCSNVLFLKILMLKYERHDMHFSDSNYLDEVLSKLLMQNRTFEIGAIKHFEKIYGNKSLG